MKVREIYDSVCSDLLERGGFTRELVTDADFLRHYKATHEDFLQISGISKTIHVQPAQAGESIYDLPDYAGDPQEIFVDRDALGLSSESDLAHLESRWQSRGGAPRSWSQDKAKMTQVRIVPPPRDNGRQVSCSIPGLYGTVASSGGSGASIEITCPGVLFGTISGESGPVSLIPSGPFFGTISRMVAARTNIAAIVSAGPFWRDVSLDSVVEHLPGSFALYVGYGILAKIFSTDGETKNDQLARYCYARYDEGITLAKTFAAAAIEEN